MPIPRPGLHLFLPLVAFACGGSDLSLPTGAPGAQVVMVQGDEQVGLPGAPLADQLIVRVTDADGNPLADQPVSWVVNSGGGAVDPVSASSNAEGLAFAEWILGPTPGLNMVQAQVAGTDAVTFTATGRTSPGGGGGGGDTDGVPAQIAEVEGDGQTAEAGARVAVSPAVRVTDSSGDPVADVTVTFAVTSGGGSLEGATQTTGSDGIARVGRWTLGATPGSNTLEARSGDLNGNPVVFTAQGTAPAPESEVDRLVYRFPPAQFIRRNETFPIKVALVDAHGDVVPLDNILIYLELFPVGSENPTSQAIEGSRFESTVDGIASFEISITRKGEFRLRALTDDLPELGPHGPEPWLYSYVFEVR
jgi:adhesin/invasin